MTAAGQADFDALLTTGRNLRFQQNLQIGSLGTAESWAALETPDDVDRDGRRTIAAD